MSDWEGAVSCRVPHGLEGTGVEPTREQTSEVCP